MMKLTPSVNFTNILGTDFCMKTVLKAFLHFQFGYVPGITQYFWVPDFPV